MSRARVAYFTGGTVGAGHLVRGVAIGRALARRGFEGTYRMFGPPLLYEAANRADYEPVAMTAKELRDPAQAATSALAAALTDFRPDLLLVDLFWAPLRHILPIATTECWLLIRTCPQVWFTGPPDTRFDAQQFRRIIAIEPFRHAAVGEHIDPIVVCNPGECRPPNALRERLEIPAGQPVVVVAHAGVAGEVWDLAPNEPGEPIICDLFAENSLFPLAEWLPGADRIFAAAGYNTFWEAQWLGYAARTHFTAMTRQIDDQAWRLAQCARVTMRANGADTLAAAIAGA